VFEWQLDELRRMLGDHTDGFDLHAWFDALHHKARDSCLVIPQRDYRAWLHRRSRKRGAAVADCRPPPTTAVAASRPTRLAGADSRGRRHLTVPEFADMFALLAVQLRQTDADEAVIRGYYDGLHDVDPEFLKAAAEPPGGVVSAATARDGRRLLDWQLARPA
jgi:hypothetical protein